MLHTNTEVYEKRSLNPDEKIDRMAYQWVCNG